LVERYSEPQGLREEEAEYGMREEEGRE